MSKIRIAVCQILCLDGDRRGNLARIENAVAEAAGAGAQIACLPEMAIYGWVNPEAHQRAQAIPGADSDFLCEMAGEHGICLTVGLAEKDGVNLYDTAILVDSVGKILLKHRKINLLSELMTPPYAPGRDVAVTETEFGRVGLLICADTHDRAILTRMAGLRPDLVLVPYGYAAPEEAWPQHGGELERVVTNAAKTVGVPVIGTNLVGRISHGPWKGRTYAGHSVAAEGTGRILATARDFDREVVIVSVTSKT